MSQGLCVLLALTSESCKIQASVTGVLHTLQFAHMQQHAVFCKILVLYGSNAYPVMLHFAWNPMLTHYPGGHGVRQIDFHVVHTSMVLNTSYATYILLLYATPNCVSKMVPNNRGCFVLIKSWRMLLPQSNMPI